MLAAVTPLVAEPANETMFVPPVACGVGSTAQVPRLLSSVSRSVRTVPPLSITLKAAARKSMV